MQGHPHTCHHPSVSASSPAQAAMARTCSEPACPRYIAGRRSKGAEGCHSSFITLIPLTTLQSMRAFISTSLHKALRARITKLACNKKFTKNRKRILEPISQKPWKPHKIRQMCLVYYSVMVVLQKHEITPPGQLE